jgi:IS4 transposase
MAEQSPGSKAMLERVDAVFPKPWLMKTARETGLVDRLRDFNPVLCFWILVLHVGARTRIILEGLRRDYNRYATDALAHSSFFDRFTPELVKFLHVCVLHALEELGRMGGRTLSDRLKRFKDILIQDSTIVRVHAKLAKIWPAVRARKVAAGVKLATLVSVIADGPQRVQLFGERASEISTLRIGPWVRERILLMDLGFFKYQIFARIRENGGYFVSRLKENADPVVTRLVRTVRGASIDLVGENLRDVLPRLKRKVLDVEVEVAFRRRAYGGSTRGDTQVLRVVAVWDPEHGEYHVYVTNLSADWFTAEDITSLYRCRWEVELLFREMKDKFQLDQLATTRKETVEALLWIGVLHLTIHRIVFVTMLQLRPDRAAHYSHERSAATFVEAGAHLLLLGILQYQDVPHDPLTMLHEVQDSGAFNPHRKTGTHMGGWRA